MPYNTWLSFIFNYGSRKITVSSGRRGKACCSCRCSGSGKLAIPGFRHGKFSYRTDRCLFAFPGSQAPFRDIRVPESCLQPETRELPAFLRSHSGRSGTPFPSCFRQYPFIFPVFAALIPADRITVYAGISGISSGNYMQLRLSTHEGVRQELQLYSGRRQVCGEAASGLGNACQNFRIIRPNTDAFSLCAAWRLPVQAWESGAGMCIFCRKQPGEGSRSLKA